MRLVEFELSFPGRISGGGSGRRRRRRWLHSTARFCSPLSPVETGLDEFKLPDSFLKQGLVVCTLERRLAGPTTVPVPLLQIDLLELAEDVLDRALAAKDVAVRTRYRFFGREEAEAACRDGQE